jgi:hypothetical protein
MTAPGERNVDGIATTVFDAAEVELYDFLRLDLPSPNGIIRYTNFPQGYVGDIDGAGSQTWVAADIKPSTLNWSQTTPEDVAWVDIWNTDNVWSTLLLNYNIDGYPIRLWQAWINPGNGALYGRPLMWKGLTDVCGTQGGTTMRLGLVPSRSNLGVMAPWAKCASTCQQVFRDAFCQYAAIANPASLTASDGGFGSKSAGTFFYAVTALHGSEETAPATASVTLAVSHRASLSWPAVAGATGYNLYYGTTSTVHLLNAGQNLQTLAFTDSLASPGVGSQVPPVSNGTGLQTVCNHATGDCDVRGNRQHFLGFPNMTDQPLMWAQRPS